MHEMMNWGNDLSKVVRDGTASGWIWANDATQWYSFGDQPSAESVCEEWIINFSLLMECGRWFWWF
ncbi:MAG: hypothetical protein ACTS4U_01765 [Candidatus Hodgkinia cicadicola]